MTALPRAYTALILTCLTVLVGCSNGRGSVEETQGQTPPATFTVGGAVSGLTGAGLVLLINGAGNLTVTANGPIAFSTPLADGAAYTVTILSQPDSQSCTVDNGAGTIAGGNVTNIAVTCTGGASGAFAVRGAVTGLLGSGLVLQNNGADDLVIASDGEFSFPTAVPAGAAYNVTASAHPTDPAQTCTVTNAAGTMGGADVTNVAVTCATATFSVGGAVSGLAGAGLVLQNNGGNDLAISDNGDFAFSQAIASGATYNVTVRTQPASPLQTCTVTNAAGTVEAENIVNVMVSCATDTFTIGGSVRGLAGDGLVLQLNGGNDRAITSDAPFQFPIGLASGTPYIVTIKTQPDNPTQICSIANASGIAGASDVSNIVVTCTTPSFSIGGTVTGLEGSGLVLRKNGGDDLPIASNGSFTFVTEQASGSAYEVSVATQPLNPSQSCTVANGGGTVGAGAVRDVRVTCAVNSYSVGGAVSGLLGDGLVLQNNGGNDLGVDADGAFVFPKIASGGAYKVTVKTQPTNPTQSCTVANGAGTVTTADITNVAVACTTSSFMIGGTVSGLAGSGLVLRNNGADDITVNSSQTTFTFPTAVASGAAYSVEIVTQPTGPAQDCTIANATGVVGDSHITNVEVSCTTIEFMVGGSVSGLEGSGLQLQNNGGPGLAIAADGAFEFPASLPPGAQYNVGVLSQPTNPSQTCVVANGAGTISGADVDNVSVTCTTNTYTIGGTTIGLTGVRLRLQLNGAEVLEIGPAFGTVAFSFETLVPSGQPYNVTVVQQPDPPFMPPQTCTVANGSGTVGADDVTDVTVNC